MSELATLDGAVDELRGRVRGAVIMAADPDERPVFNAMHPGHPAVTVRCSGTADVIAGVNFAREHGLALAVRGGGHSIAGLSAIDGGVLLDLEAMRGCPRGSGPAARRRPGRRAVGRRRPRDAGLRARRPGRRRLRHGRRGPDAGRRLRLGTAQVRPVGRRARRGAGRLRRRPASARRRPSPTRTCSGRCAAAAGTSASSRRSRSRCSRSARSSASRPRSTRSRRSPRSCAAGALRRRGARRGHVGGRDDDLPGEPGAARGDPRPPGRDRRWRVRRRPGGRAGGHGPAARARDAAVRHVRADAVHGGAVRLRPAVPAQLAARLLEVPVPRRALRRGDRRHRRPRARSSRAAHAGQHVPHGRRDRRGRAGGDGVRGAVGALHGLDRRHLERPGRRRGHDRLGALGVGGRAGVRQRRRVPQLHRPRGRGPRRRRRHRVRAQPRPAARVKATYDPGNLFRVNHNILPA